MLERPSAPEALSSKELLAELFSDAQLLLERQVKLARLEGKRQLAREKIAAGFLGAGAVLAYAGTIVLLVAAGIAIGDAIGGRDWLGTLIVGAVLVGAAALAGAIGWARRVKSPLARTRRELAKELTWARHHHVTT